MIGLEPVIELVTAGLWTGQLQGERPVSMILVAPPGTGKTSVLEMLQCNISKFFSDFTSREIRGALKENGDLTHLMLGDFLALFGHSKGTVKLAINLVGRLTGDTVRQTPWTGEDIPPRRMGLITAIPPNDLQRREVRAHVRAGGFASRFIIAKYDYSAATIEKIHQYIRKGLYRKEKIFQIEINKGRLLVEVPYKIAIQIDMLSRKIKNDPIGFRAHHHLRALACALARSKGRVTVNNSDLERLTFFCDFFSEQGKVL